MMRLLHFTRNDGSQPIFIFESTPIHQGKDESCD